MSLRVRLIVLSTVWLIFIFVVFNALLYAFISNATAKYERELSFAKAATILENAALRNPDQWDEPDLLRDYVTQGEMIRIIDMDGRVRQELCTDEQLREGDPYRAGRSEYWIRRTDDTRFLYVHVPIVAEDTYTQIGTLEFARVLGRWSLFMNVLASGSIILTVGAVLLSVLGSLFYTRFLLQPLRELDATMQQIQQSGAFRRLDKEFTAREDELGRLGITFNEMIARLEELVGKQKRFVADASHELRTPLTIIESYADILKRWGGSDPAIRREAVEAILGEANRLKQLVGSLMQLAETEQENWLKLDELELMGLIRSAAADMEVAFNREIRIEGNRDKVLLTGDEAELKQLLLILLDNAIKYSSAPVRVAVNAGTETVEIRVADRGIGLEEKLLPFIFDRFFRADQARARQTGGFGLGLAIAKSIVERHGGEIRMDSRPGSGTAVMVTLPT